MCLDCLCEPPPFQRTYAVFEYGKGIDELIPRLKFHADLAAGRVLSELLIESARHWPPPDALIPIPLHERRLRQRGFDQALELCKPLAKGLNLPLRTNILSRWQHTPAQSTLNRTRRQKNVRDAFCCDDVRNLPAHVALVDDVMTTGATASAAAQTLLDAGVQRVDIWVVARVA
jgi:ComF family protein